MAKRLTRRRPEKKKARGIAITALLASVALFSTAGGAGARAAWELADFGYGDLKTQQVDDLKNIMPEVNTVDLGSPLTQNRDDPPSVPTPKQGEQMGMLYIPAWKGLADLGEYITIEEGGVNNRITDAMLSRGQAVHYSATALPGDLGNTSYAAHRRSHGSSFRYMDRLKNGDTIHVITPTAIYTYEIKQKIIVPENQVRVIDATPPGQKPGRWLTLTTCSTADGGQYGNTHRYIVHAEFQYWSPAEEAGKLVPSLQK